MSTPVGRQRVGRRRARRRPRRRRCSCRRPPDRRARPAARRVPRRAGGRWRGRRRGARRGGRARRARRRPRSRPGAARRPASACSASASSISSREPASAAPTGAPRPLVKSIQAVSKPRVHSLAGTPAGHDRVHQPRAVQVRAQAGGRGGAEHAAQAVERPHAAAGDVRRVLHGDEPRARRVAVRGVVERRGQRGGVEGAARAVERGEHRAPQRRRAARLEAQRVGGAVQQHLVAAVAEVQAEADRVAHRARRQEDGGLVAEQLGDALAQRRDRRVGEALLVADVGLGHRAAHRLRVGRVWVSE